MEETRHKYEYQVDKDADTAPARVVRIVGNDKRVLEIGAGPGSITKLLKGVGNCRVTAMEIDAEAIKKLALYCEQVYQVDLNDPAWCDAVKLEPSFEVIVAADVLEHVYEPLAVLKAMKRLLNERGYMVVSLPHVGHSALHACLLAEDFEYRDWGLLDRTHIRFFGIKNMQKLFEDAGLKILHAEFVVRDPAQTEFSHQWSKLSPELRRALQTNPFGRVYQVVIKAVPMEAGGEAISLLSLPVVSTARRSNKYSFRSLARALLSPQTRTRLRLAAVKMGLKG